MCLIVAKRTTVYWSKELMNIIKIVNNEMFIRQQKKRCLHTAVNTNLNAFDVCQLLPDW